VRENTGSEARVPLLPVLLPCLLSMAAWEVARLALRMGEQAPGTSHALLSSLVRAVILLLPSALVARHVFRERLSLAFWLGAPARSGLLRSVAIGAAYLLAVNGLNVALGYPFSLPTLPAGEAALLVFDAAVEEALFRGFVLSHLARGRRLAWANLSTALIFMLPHTRTMLHLWGDGLHVELAPVLLSLFLLALTLGASAGAVRSIWIACAVHALNNLLATL
jgi:membrane protease YdiL (CAAX protease family)